MRWPFLFLLPGAWGLPLAAQAPAEPPNAPATLVAGDSSVTLLYHGDTLFTGTLRSSGVAPVFVALVDSGGGRVTQVLKWTASRATLVLEGGVRGSEEAFAVEAEPREDGLRVVRHQSGAAVNRLNRAVYDRHGDWLVSVDVPAAVRVEPTATDGRFRFTARGGEITLRFRPRFYQRHRGLAEYRPWTYRPWGGSVAGWTSWYAYFDKVTARDIERMAEVLGRRLGPYGYQYLQIDDGYQQNPIGLPSHWLTPNAKFPGGLTALHDSIRARGLVPGIWTNVSFADREAALAHPGWFVPAAGGGPAWGHWVGYVMDGTAAGAMDTLVTPVYRALRAMGWGYFKLDALRHLRYEGYNSQAPYFLARGVDRAAVFREVVRRVREAIGPEAYLLACWGIRPELIGLVDGVRVGDDGFGYGSFAQYNSFNNVVWRNDPDHIELHQPDGYRAATLTSLTGSVLMLTDRPEVYEGPRVEAARRTAPVLFTRPGQVYDVDPSRSALLAGANTEVSGSGPRPFDADQREVVSLYQLAVARAFGQWTVLARTRDDEAAIPLAELGLAEGTDYVGLEFWTKRSLGTVRDTLRPGAIAPEFGVQVACLRAREGHPQVLASSRHVSCGGPDLLDVRWEGDALIGESELVAGDRYELYLSAPAGFRFAGVEASDAQATSVRRADGVRVVRLDRVGGGRVRWRVRYQRG
ncbi:MAG: alpha-galactosidase [Gemmatimonadetes bacterium]|nr:alpha-galactosidase [Gemmatimonadota bacterium]